MIAIIDYGAGNLTSVKLAFQALNVAGEITDDPARVLAADRVVFPGVGAAGASMENLRRLALVDALKTVAARGTPFLGICVGTQILFEHSDEDGGTPCLGILPGTVKRFRPVAPRDKVPHMGWNTVAQTRPHPVFQGIADHSEFYFVHSYYPDAGSPDTVFGKTDYAGISFASVVGQGRVVATQFHVEKSGRIGLRMLENFCRWMP